MRTVGFAAVTPETRNPRENAAKGGEWPRSAKKPLDSLGKEILEKPTVRTRSSTNLN
jgi:hypothetical protein